MKEGELCITLSSVQGSWDLMHTYWTVFLWQFRFKLSIFHQDLDMVPSAKHFIVCFKELHVMVPKGVIE